MLVMARPAVRIQALHDACAWLELTAIHWDIDELER